MDILYKKITEIKPYEKNPRKNDDAVDSVANSIKEFGFKQPIVVDKNNIIVAGHTRYRAAKKLGLKEVPVMVANDLTDEQIKAYRLADNKTAELADWDLDLLGLELDDILDIDMSQFGFDLSGKEPKEIVEDDFDADAEFEPITQLGDIWHLGRHRLMCGDSTDGGTVATLMDGKKADMVFTDPPYNVDYSNADRPKASKTDLGKIKNDVMPVEDFIQFLSKAFKRLDEFSKQDSAFYIWYASNMTLPFLLALKETNIEHNQQIIWKKPMLLGRGKYQWAHEPCIFGIKGKPYHTKDRTKTTVWDFGGYDKGKNVHPTQKPLMLPAEALENSSKREDNILDLFGGSGSTLMACEQLNRICYTMELDPKYCDVIVNRYIKYKNSDEDVYLERNGERVSYGDIVNG